ncbi:hypothetical protein [Streptodolium elevatio]|uniref:Endonuclease/exonuclease/phosphatase domain-containing protein n=1 Tax=Streptodolium elevatio TaxID=3157996 RepID=A0ABV3D9S6_9ACTN
MVLSLLVAPTAAAHDGMDRVSVRAMTWNVCEEAGVASPTDAGYCPYRNEPQRKVEAIAEVVAARSLNTVLLQEICWGAPNSALELLKQQLGPQWKFVTAVSSRPDGGSHCRGALTGTLGIAIGVKGNFVDPAPAPVELPIPGELALERSPILCADVVGWTDTVCTTHLNNSPGADHAGQVLAVRNVVAALRTGGARGGPGRRLQHQSTGTPGSDRPDRPRMRRALLRTR